MKIHLAYEDEEGNEIDSVFGLIPFIKKVKTKNISSEGLDVYSKRFLVFDKDKSIEKILESKDIFEDLKNTDKEIDFEECGYPIEKLSTIMIDENYNPIYNYKLIKEKNNKRKDYFPTNANINTPNMPLIILPKNLFSKEEIFMNYIFTKNYYIVQLDRNQFKDLYFLAKKLSSLNKLMRIKVLDESMKQFNPNLEGNALILKKRGKPYPIALIEGKIKGEKYALILHLSYRDVKIPKKYNLN